MIISVAELVSKAWISYTNIGVLLGTLALALSSASKDNVSLYFGYVYALISCGVVVSRF
jgi:hypothetical protein